MDTAINFYELKTQLSDLGFREMEMVDDLRFNITSSEGHFLLVTQIEGEQQETQFFFQMVRDEEGRYNIAHYEAVMDSLGKTGHQYQLFQPEVSAAEAMLLLDLRTDFPGHLLANDPMGKEAVAALIEGHVPEPNLDGRISDDDFTYLLKVPHEGGEKQLIVDGFDLEIIAYQLKRATEQHMGYVTYPDVPGSILKPEYMAAFRTREEVIKICEARSDLGYLEVHSLQKSLHQNTLTNQNNNIMSPENLAFVKDNIKYLGLGEELGAQFEKQAAAQPETITLQTRIEHYSSNMDFTVHLKKGTEADMYFLNKYDATLSNGKPEEDKTQTFYITKGQGVTAKEAFNLLEGRAVQKELKTKENEPYKAWLQLDLGAEKDKNNNYTVQKYSENYGYDLDKALSRFNIKDLADPDAKDKLIKSLEKGNLQQVSSEKDGTTSKHYIAANPQYKTINVYSEQQKIVRREGLMKSNPSETKKDQKQDQKESETTEKKRGRKQSA
jgi:hypothetical protein